MPVHDWTRVPAGLFHDFHQVWSIMIRNTLNRRLLPEGFTALVEQRSGPREGDILAIESEPIARRDRHPSGGTATMDRPTAKIIRQTDRQYYAKKANRIVVRHHLGEIVAVIELVSPGNKDSVRSLSEFTEKIFNLLDAGIHALVVDLFPPTRRDAFGIHKAIWDQMVEEDFSFPTGCDRIAAAYEAADQFTAYVEPFGVGDTLPEMPLFLIDGFSVKLPLEETYNEAWADTPEVVRRLLTGAQSK
jgi:hypothetical protein